MAFVSHPYPAVIFLTKFPLISAKPSPFLFYQRVPLLLPSRRTTRRQLSSLAVEGNNNDKVVNAGEEVESRNGSVKKEQRRSAVSLRWRDLLSPDPENLVAVGLTGMLAWASVQVLTQLFLISIAILLAALKYSFIAALLLFILITLL